MSTIADIQAIQFPSHTKDDAILVVYEHLVPFAIKRVFVVHANTPTIRGRHAHRHCQQLLVVTMGECKVICDDGQQRSDFLLNNPSQGLLIPAGIWAEQHYITQSSTLMVFCDQQYDEDDYIRDYQQYLSYIDRAFAN